MPYTRANSVWLKRAISLARFAIRTGLTLARAPSLKIIYQWLFFEK
jgi:hypothetical protein